MPDSIAETYESLTEEEQDMIFPPAFPPAYGAPQAATLEITGLADSWVDMTVNTRLDSYARPDFRDILIQVERVHGVSLQDFLEDVLMALFAEGAVAVQWINNGWESTGPAPSTSTGKSPISTTPQTGPGYRKCISRFLLDP